MNRFVPVWLSICVLGGCATQAPLVDKNHGPEFVAATFAKMAARVFDSDHVEYDVSVGEVFSSRELEVLSKNVDSVRDIVASALARQDSLWGAKLAAHFRIRECIPSLRSRFFTPRRCYGWEGPDYDQLESFLADNQYQYSVTYSRALEQLVGAPIWEAVVAMPDELAMIDRYAADEESEFYHWSLWIKRKVKIPAGPPGRGMPSGVANQIGAANGSQPIGSETTRTSSAAGSRR